jgi:hypothetical protein
MPSVSTCGLLCADFLFGLLFDVEDGADMCLQHGELLPQLMVLHL